MTCRERAPPSSASRQRCDGRPLCRSAPANQARLSATATNDAPSTIVVVATTIATTRVQAKIFDCSKVTRLTTRAKRRVRMNKTPSTAHDTNCRNLPARWRSTGAIQSHIFAKRKTQIYQTKVSVAAMQKGRTRAMASSIWPTIHLIDGDVQSLPPDGPGNSSDDRPLSQ